MAQQTETRTVFHTGRNARTLIWILLCAFLVAFSLLRSGIRVELGAPSSPVEARWLLPAVGGGVMLATMLLAYVRSSLEVSGHGIIFRDWRGRVTSVTWERLREVVVRAQRTSGSSTSISPRNIVTAWLVYTAQHGSSVRLKITTDSSFKRVDRMARLLAERAGLERSDNLSDRDRVWSRP